MLGAWRRSNRLLPTEFPDMRSIPAITVALCVLPSPLFAQQDSTELGYANTIQQRDLRAYLDTLASDEFEGRETGMPGQKKAARFIREHFQRFGIPPVPEAEKRGIVNGYELPYPLEVMTPGGLSLVVNGQSIGFMEDYFYFSEKLQGDLSSDSITYMGYGGADAPWSVAGRVCLVLRDPREGMQPGAVPSSGFVQELSRKAAIAEAHGVRLLLVASEDAHNMMRAYAQYITGPRMKLGGRAEAAPTRPAIQAIVIDRRTAERILATGRLSWKKAVKRARKAPRRLQCPILAHNVPTRQEMRGENVLGYVEGGDKKNELVVITAHYDHLGKSGGEVYNGADDDGSGTVSVLELAQAFAQAKREGHGPRRSMLFMTVSGEEKGLLGSEWYSEHPAFPLESTVADLNIDMVGRVDTAHKENEHYVYVIGSDRLSTELHRINETANATYTKLDLDYTFNADSDPNRFYFRSDHYNFAKHGIPIIFYFNGVHEDYHEPTDEVSKIRYDLLEQRARLVFHTAWELANREQRIVVDKPMPKD